MIGRLLGRVVSLPLRVAAVPWRILERTAGVEEHEPISMGGPLRRGAKAIEDSIAEVIDE